MSSFNYPVAPFNDPSSLFLNRWAPASPYQYGGYQPKTWGTSAVTPYAYGGVQGVDRDMLRMRHDMERAFRDISSGLSQPFTSSLTYQPSRPTSMLEHYSLLNPIQIDAEGNRSLNCCFDLRSFKPEEINVTLSSKDRTLNIEAHHEVKDREHYVKRAYSRRVYIPETPGVDLSKVELTSCLTNEGLLCVEAALPKLSIEEARNLAPPVVASGTSAPINVRRL